MQDRVYLLDLAEFREELKGAGLLQRAMRMVDEKRLEKVMRMHNAAVQAASLGAGLLIQKAVADRERPVVSFRRLGVEELLGELEQDGAPLPLEYCYGEQGKPYLQNIPMQFNLSHSGDHVLCAVSECEIGADIQQMRKLSNFRVAERYFSPSEMEKIRGSGERERQAEMFYGLWTRKEAYGKLTGEGIVAAVGQDMDALGGEVVWLECEAPEGYRIAVCKEGRNMTEWNSEQLTWIREPAVYSIEEDRIEIVTEPHTDLWQRTYYHFRNDNAPVLQIETEETYFSFEVKTDFADSHHRFDQCGIVLYLDSENWLKASVEYENEDFQHLGSVVTNHGYSDWATTAIPATVKSMWYRLSRREDDFCVECSEDGITYRQMRVCHLHEAKGGIRFGIYACSPEESSFRACFTDMKITECKWPAHDGQAPDEA